jgi:glycosyltransferase involved in cell wall biosynthesis
MQYLRLIKFAVGIPSLNEADNITNLTQQVDRAAQALGIEVCIINADNSSEDGTAALFKETKTVNPKISILTKGRGKGRNVLSILEYVAGADDIEYCFLIDADITSFDQKWLKAQYAKYKQGMDYVLPQYKRKYIEGNATNHFSYPMMYYLLDGVAPRQPIAGDIGLSKRLIASILELPRNESINGYGIDMFISTSTLYFDVRISEVMLDQKLHKPSFSKMVLIFQEEASAFYFARQHASDIRARFVDPAEDAPFLDAIPIPDDDLNIRFQEARTLYNNSKNLIKNGSKFFTKQFISEHEWADIIAQHEELINTYPAEKLSESLTPYYLLRCVSYLKTIHDPLNAQKVITEQAGIIRSTIKNRTKV